MAYEVSEIMTATALQKSNSKLEAIRTLAKKGSADEVYAILYNMIKEGKEGKGIEFGEGAKNGFLSKMTLTDSVKQNYEQATNMAASVSAAIAIRTYVKITDKPLTIYLSGNKFHRDIKFLQVNAFGFKDYNSSDLMITSAPGKVDDKKKDESNTKKMYYGISLKKKKTVTSSSPTLINKAVSSLFDGKEYDEMKEKIVNVRVKYFADLVRDATKTKPPIIRKEDIGNADWSAESDDGGPKDLKLMKAPNKNVKIFGPRGSKGKTYIDTKGWFGAHNDKGGLGYTSKDKNITKDSRSMRYFVNKKLDWTKLMSEKGHPLWSEYKKAIESPWTKSQIPIKHGAEKLAKDLLNIILKLKLYDQLNAKVLNGNEFKFALITGIGEAKKLKTGIKVSIDSAKVYDLKTTLCGMSRIHKDRKNKGPYRVEFDKGATEGAEAAKIFFKIMKGSFNIMSLRIRYKGKFNPKPQFQAYMTDEAIKEFQKECSG